MAILDAPWPSMRAPLQLAPQAVDQADELEVGYQLQRLPPALDACAVSLQGTVSVSLRRTELKHARAIMF